MTADQCYAKAVEAETLAKLVSLETDRRRLLEMAQGWRERAALLARTNDAPSPGSGRTK